jgi:uncharacterized membrane protein
MAQQSTPTDVTSDDKLWAALAYGITILMPLIILLFMPDKKTRPFIRAHNMQALVAGIALAIVATILSGIIAVITLGIGACISPIIGLAAWAVMLYWGYKAYQGQYVTIPVITNFVKNQGWA